MEIGAEHLARLDKGGQRNTAAWQAALQALDNLMGLKSSTQNKVAIDGTLRETLMTMLTGSGWTGVRAHGRLAEQEDAIHAYYALGQRSFDSRPLDLEELLNQEFALSSGAAAHSTAPPLPTPSSPTPSPPTTTPSAADAGRSAPADRPMIGRAASVEKPAAPAPAMVGAPVHHPAASLDPFADLMAQITQPAPVAAPAPAAAPSVVPVPIHVSPTAPTPIQPPAAKPAPLAATPAPVPTPSATPTPTAAPTAATPTAAPHLVSEAEAAQDLVLAKILALKVGSTSTWISATDEMMVLKLSWISPISQKFLFVNGEGARALAGTARELAGMARKGRFFPGVTP